MTSNKVIVKTFVVKMFVICSTVSTNPKQTSENDFV